MTVVLRIIVLKSLEVQFIMTLSQGHHGRQEQILRRLVMVYWNFQIKETHILETSIRNMKTENPLTENMKKIL